MENPSRNLVLVVVDALRKDRVGALSDGDSLTPNVDALAEGGAVFENAFSATNATDPSITSMHTGRDPNEVVTHHGPHVTDEEKRRAEAVDSVPELLQAAGYRTVAAGRPLGRWHKSGFDVYPEEALDVQRRRSIGQFLERVHPGLRSVAGSIYDRLAALRDDVAGDEVDDLLDAVTDDSFYGFVHMMDPHMPCEPDPALIDDLLERRDYPNEDLERFFEEHEDNPYVSDFLGDVVTDADYEVGLARLFARYDGAVVEADRKVGQLLEGLRERGRLEETTVVVVSDHGESLDEHGIYFDHHGLYEPSIRVPMVVSGPGVEAARRDEYVQLSDLAPTVLDTLGVEGDLGGMGRTLRPLLGGVGEWSERDAVMVGEAQAQRRVGIRTDDYKYIKHVPDPVLEKKRGSSLRCEYCHTVHGGERELYDLSIDPGEETNLVADESAVAAELDEELEAYLDGLETPQEETGERVTYDEEEAVLDRLEDLGYK